MLTDQDRRNTVAVGEEHAFVDKDVYDRERVRVRTEVQTRDQSVSAILRSEEVSVERIPINREVRAVPELRREGDTLIIPVVEEQVVVTKRLILKEELRIVRRTKARRVEQTVPVRRVRAVVEREDLREGNPPYPGGPDHGPDDHSPLRHAGRGRSREAPASGPDRRR